MGLCIVMIFGGVGVGLQFIALRVGVEIIIGCFGWFVDYFGSRAFDFGGIEIMVFDEVDYMVDVGFLFIVCKLLDVMPRDGQRMLFLVMLVGGVDQVVCTYLHDFVLYVVVIEVLVEMMYYVLVIHVDDRVLVVVELVYVYRVVVFICIKYWVKQLSVKLEVDGLVVVVLYGNLLQNVRIKNLDVFFDGIVSVMVVIDIAVRGIYVDDVLFVVHVDLFMEYKVYVHCLGCIARVGVEGMVVMIVMVDQVNEVRDLLRWVSITATWFWLIGIGGAVVVFVGRGEVFVLWVGEVVVVVVVNFILLVRGGGCGVQRLACLLLVCLVVWVGLGWGQGQGGRGIGRGWG